MVFTNQGNEAECVGRILRVEHSSDTNLSKSPSNVSLSSALRIAEATSSNQSSNDWGATGGYPTDVAALDATAILRSLQKIGSWIVITVTFSFESRRFKFIIPKFSNRESLKN